ncbi:HEAT repeat domain-containing protein [Verrucomicrobia bacterium S94]|nr:HEAT repeat domain-containing protein [Verrucomicrobia bacterium S94]
MKNPLFFLTVLTTALCISGTAQPAVTNSPTSIQEMLISGTPQYKMHFLAMISQGKVKVNESYIPGLETCATHPSIPLRSLSAKLLGQYFIREKDAPNEEALAILLKLAHDPEADVRFNAIFYGLTQVKYKTPELAEQLIDIAAKERNPALQDRIIVSLANYQPQVEEILNKKLNGEHAIAYYEIYEDFTGKEPPHEEKFLNMPSSRPRLLVIKANESNPEVSKPALIQLLKQGGLKNPTVETSGTGESYVLMLTTYITRDYKNVREVLSANDDFSITQDLWLTPELEIQIEAMRKAQ